MLPLIFVELDPSIELPDGLGEHLDGAQVLSRDIVGLRGRQRAVRRRHRRGGAGPRNGGLPAGQPREGVVRVRAGERRLEPRLAARKAPTHMIRSRQAQKPPPATWPRLEEDHALQSSHAFQQHREDKHP